MRAVFLGALNMDQIVRVAHLPRPGETVTGGDVLRAPGGKASNQAVAAARLGAAATMVGRVGRDAFGRELTRSLRTAGVSTRQVTGCERPTGSALIFVAEDGENTIAVSPGANDELRPEDLPRGAIQSADAMVATLEAPLTSLEAAFRLAREGRVPTVLNAAPAHALPRSTLDLCDVVICNETELATLTGRPVEVGSERGAAKSLRAFAQQMVVVTLGARGALAVSGDEVFEQPAFDVRVVDTVGAGDAFVAGFVVGRGQPWSEVVGEALRWGCAAGSLATTRQGAQPSMPALGELQSLLELPVSRRSGARPGPRARPARTAAADAAARRARR